MAVDKNSKAYQSLLNKWYTDEQINQMSSSVSWWQSAKDVVASTQPTNTTVTYWGKSNVTPTNVVSQQSQNANYNNAKVNTWAVASMPEQPKTTTSGINIDNVAKAWNNMDYATQQDRLSKISWLKEALAKNWITIKEAPEQTNTQATTQSTTTKASTPTKTTTATKTTPQQDRWDYQDNSQARMNEIANNLNWYRQTNPWLFEDGSAFYNFFIKDKGRSQDQIDFLWDYFNRVQKFWKYDNLPASTIWDMLVNGKLWDDYLNYLKSTDPQKYQEALSYRQDWEDTIKYESYLSDIAEQVGLSLFEKFYKWIFGYRDENDDKIDDSLYIAPTEEEQTKQNRVNEIDSRIMEIKNMQKNLLDDLVEQYPWVPKATLMWIVQDRTKDISREYDDLMVERTWLVWNIEYMQNERNAQMDARQQTINNLKTAYGMYYDYTAEWISEMAQNKYAATNITLDQADRWNETQKQMALQSVLDDYYAKYGSIIQRSEQQVINDVIAYAKKNWIWLAQALQENFVKPLQQKPQFATLSSGWTLWWAWTDKWSDIKVKDAKWNDVTLKMNQSTWEILNLDWTPYTWKIQTTTTGWASFTPVSYSKMYSESARLQEEYPEWSSYKNWRCWELGNLYLERIGSDIRFWDDVSTKTRWITNDDPNSTPAVWSIVVWDYSNNPNVAKVARDSWHVAIVTNVNSDWSFDVYEQNWDGKHQVWYRTIKNRNYIAWFIDPADTTWLSASWWAWWDISDVTYEVSSLAWIPTQLRNTDVEKQWYLDILWKMKESWLNAFDAAMSLIWFTVTNKSAEAQNTKNKILNAVRMAWSEEVFDWPSMQNMANAINAWDYELALQTLENKVNNFMSSKWLTNVISTKIQPTMTTVNTLRWVDAPWWKTGTVQSALDEWKLQNITSTQILSLRADLRKKLRDIWYENEDLDYILPDLNDTKKNFIQKLDDIENTILLDTMNSWRRIYWLPDMTTDVLLWRDGVSSLYKISNSDQLLNMISKQWKPFSTLFNR